MMEKTIRRRQTSFRLRIDLLDAMKIAAERENRTLNNFVEYILMNSMRNEPNDVTKVAIEEAISGENQNKVYVNVDEMFDDVLADD